MEKVYGTYKKHLIVETRHHWGYEVVAIPDEGETLRRKFIGYTRKEMAQAMRDMIDESLGVKAMKTSKGALQKSIKWQQIILASSKDTKQKERARLAIARLLEELQNLEEELEA